MTPITFLGKRYYIAHNHKAENDPSHCGGCVFENKPANECPNNYLNTPLNSQCDANDRIYIHRTKKAVAEWVAWKLDGFKEQE